LERQDWQIHLRGHDRVVLSFRNPAGGDLSGLMRVSFSGPPISIQSLHEMLAPPEEMFAVPRNPRWRSVRNHFIEKNPTCAACGGTAELEAHHVLSFHEHPELELEESNLITLCRAPTRLCHFLYGHSGRWDWSNRHVREDAALMLSRFRAREAATLLD
jgi:hypothetical protein